MLHNADRNPSISSPLSQLKHSPQAQPRLLQLHTQCYTVKNFPKKSLQDPLPEPALSLLGDANQQPSKGKHEVGEKGCGSISYPGPLHKKTAVRLIGSQFKNAVL